jgi:hypothetical protein
MKLLILLAGSLLSSLGAFAQTVTQDTVLLNGNKHVALAATFDESRETVEGALMERLKSDGLTRKKKKEGFLLFTNVKWDDMGGQKLDIYFKVEREKREARIYMLTGHGQDSLITNESDPQMFMRMRVFLEGFKSDIDSYLKLLAVQKQQAEVAKAKEAHEEALEKNRKAAKEADEKADRKQKELEKEKKKLDEMK